MTEAGEESRQERTLHLLNRLGFGPRPGDFERVRAMGDERYIQEQLYPESIAIARDLTERVNEYRTIHMSPIALFAEFERPIREARRNARADSGGDKAAIKDATKGLRIQQRVVMREAVEARLMRAIEYSRDVRPPAVMSTD